MSLLLERGTFSAARSHETNMIPVTPPHTHSGAPPDVCQNQHRWGAHAPWVNTTCSQGDILRRTPAELGRVTADSEVRGTLVPLRRPRAGPLREGRGGGGGGGGGDGGPVGRGRSRTGEITIYVRTVVCA